jgi:hypothetical protein
VHPSHTQSTRFLPAAVIVAALLCAVTAGLAHASGVKDGSLAKGIGCSTFGPSWAHTYNTRAVLAGNPVRILSACCTSTETAGVNHCFVTVTLDGTADRGCETVDIGRNGWPSGPGRHRKCVSTRQQVA